METTDVLILGGGPTGLTLALELAAQGIPFRIIDKSTAGRSDKSRALVVQARTLELLNRHGIARDLQSRGVTSSGATFCVNGREIGGVDVENARLPHTAFPLQLLVSQQETEHFLDEALARYGHAVEWGVEATALEQDDEGTTATLSMEKKGAATAHKEQKQQQARETKQGEGEEEAVPAISGSSSSSTVVLRAKYVVGCDGAHSFVRKAAGLTFDGDAYPQDFVLADTHVEWAGRPNRAYLCFGRGFLAVLPLRDGMVRVVMSRSSIRQRDGQPELDDFQDHFARMIPGGGRLHDPAWVARFRLHHRGVDRYGRGRLFVAGDAAHVHSPAGGQGMNTGIGDAVNLGWKLAAVLKGERPASLLDSYHEERHPVGQNLLQTTDRVFSWTSSSNPVFCFFRNLLLPWIMPWALSSPARVRDAFFQMSEFDITYRRGSSAVATAPGFHARLHGGDRVPDGRVRAAGSGDETWLLDLIDPRSHHLVLFSGHGAAAASEGDLQRAGDAFLAASGPPAKVHMVFAEQPNGQSGFVDVDSALSKELGFAEPAYVLIRPDGHAAHVGPLSATKELAAWLV